MLSREQEDAAVLAMVEVAFQQECQLWVENGFGERQGSRIKTTRTLMEKVRNWGSDRLVFFNNSLDVIGVILVVYGSDRLIDLYSIRSPRNSEMIMKSIYATGRAVVDGYQ